MGRAEVIEADLDRIRSMPDDVFEQQWGAWCLSQDRDVNLMRQRWIADLERMLPYARQEDAAVEELVAAKDAYRTDPTPAARNRRDVAVAAVQNLRAQERETRRDKYRIGGDAYVAIGG